jgi:hypothetical protein
MKTPFRQSATRSPSKPQQSGITLTELMIAAFITVTAVSAGGWAIATMVSSSKTNSSQNERRVELNRSLDFMATETRQAVQINVDAAPTEFAPAATEVDTTSVQSVLRLKVDGLSKPVIYYTATPATSNQAWRGPRVVYRWGPSFTSAGVYGSDKSTPSSWTHQPLVDAIESTASTVNCPSGWTASPSTGATGFYACIDASNKIAQIFNKGRISKVLGQTAPYVASTQTFARSSSPAPTIPFTIAGGGVVLSQPSTVKVKNIASQYPWPTFGMIYRSDVTSGSTALPAVGNTVTLSNVPANTTLAVAGCSATTSSDATYKVNYCPKSTTATHQGKSVFTLKNGDAVPTTDPASGQIGIKTILQPYADSTGTTIKLASNEVIYLYELYTTKPGDALYDIQDLVVLVTIN